MNWMVFQKNHRTCNPIPSLAISRTGITFSGAAMEAWVRGRKYAVILTDKEVGRVAFQFMDTKAVNAFAISRTGTKGVTLKITCNNLYPFLGLSATTRFTGIYNEQENRVEINLHEPEVPDAK